MKTITVDPKDLFISAEVNDPYECQIIDWCEDLKNSLLDKYRKGKAEHGDLAAGKPLDCAKEISNEVRDILIYHNIDIVQNSGK